MTPFVVAAVTSVASNPVTGSENVAVIGMSARFVGLFAVVERTTDGGTMSFWIVMRVVVEVVAKCVSNAETVKVYGFVEGLEVVET